jgi:hypothetical protein
MTGKSSFITPADDILLGEKVFALSRNGVRMHGDAFGPYGFSFDGLRARELVWMPGLTVRISPS